MKRKLILGKMISFGSGKITAGIYGLLLVFVLLTAHAQTPKQGSPDVPKTTTHHLQPQEEIPASTTDRGQLQAEQGMAQEKYIARSSALLILHNLSQVSGAQARAMLETIPEQEWAQFQVIQMDVATANQRYAVVRKFIQKAQHLAELAVVQNRPPLNQNEYLHIDPIFLANPRDVFFPHLDSYFLQVASTYEVLQKMVTEFYIDARINKIYFIVSDANQVELVVNWLQTVSFALIQAFSPSLAKLCTDIVCAQQILQQTNYSQGGQVLFLVSRNRVTK